MGVPEKGVGYFEVGVTGRCEPPSVGAGGQTPILCKSSKRLDCCSVSSLVIEMKSLVVPSGCPLCVWGETVILPTEPHPQRPAPLFNYFHYTCTSLFCWHRVPVGVCRGVPVTGCQLGEMGSLFPLCRSQAWIQVVRLRGRHFCLVGHPVAQAGLHLNAQLDDDLELPGPSAREETDLLCAGVTRM